MANLAPHVRNLRQSLAHVDDAKRRVEAQRAIVRRLAATDGESLTIAKLVLDSYERTLRVMRQHVEIEESLLETFRKEA